MSLDASLNTQDQIDAYEQAMMDKALGTEVVIQFDYSSHEDKLPLLHFILYSDNEGQMHREDGPAKMAWRGNELISRQFYKDGQLHRDPREGPANEHWDSNGYDRAEYFWEGNKVRANFVPPAPAPAPDGLGRVFR